MWETKKILNVLLQPNNCFHRDRPFHRFHKLKINPEAVSHMYSFSFNFLKILLSEENTVWYWENHPEKNSYGLKKTMYNRRYASNETLKYLGMNQDDTETTHKCKRCINEKHKWYIAALYFIYFFIFYKVKKERKRRDK